MVKLNKIFRKRGRFKVYCHKKWKRVRFNKKKLIEFIYIYFDFVFL